MTTLAPVSFAQAVAVWTRIALQSFGGPAGQIAVMHRVLVEEKKWISETRFLHALNYCMLLPGPEATQLITYVGWLMFGTLGGIVAGILFILPGFLSLLALSVVYVTWHDVSFVQGMLYGLKAAVIAVVVEAVIRIGKRALKNNVTLAIAASSFIAIFCFAVPFPVIVLSAAIIGLVGGRVRPEWFPTASHAPKHAAGETTAAAPSPTLIPDDDAQPASPSLVRTLGVAGAWLLAWWGPVALLALFLGRRHVLVDQAFFFSKAAVITFGGAYAVLPYVGQQAVERFGWVTAGQMLDGLGMAETTPGPLIMVLQFVGFLGAFNAAAADGSMPPLLAGLLGSLVTVWTTFVPCFLWIFVGAPYIERLRSSRALASALSGVTAAVVGVILNLAVWFALHALFTSGSRFTDYGFRVWIPDPESVDRVGVAIMLVACVALFRLRLNAFWTLGIGVALGLVGHAFPHLSGGG
ncbi:MAG: chromate efflux transporter [Planctomycetota bacterium]|nr:chromate efflux transporter [Planctomycetota bacterium]